MPTLYALKPAFQAKLRPLTDQLARAGVTANQITLLAAALSVATGIVVAAFADHRPVFLLMPVALFLRMALNAIDGMLAREHAQASTLGMYLNELCDVVSDLALILAFAAVFPAWGVVAFAIAAIIAEYAGVLGVAAGSGRNYAGPFGKSDRALALGIIAFLIACGLWVEAIAPFVFPAMATLSLATAINRIRSGLKASDKVAGGEDMIHEQKIAAAASLNSRRVEQKRSFKSHDGIEIFYRYWPAVGETAKGAILLFHRGHEHGGRMAHLVDELAMLDHAFYAWDARGNGRSAGERGYAPSFSALVRDIDCFVREIGRDGFAQSDIALIAQSFGAVLAAAWVHDYAPRIRALVMASPAFSVKLYVPFARQGIALWQNIKGRFFVNSYVKAKFLTHDPKRIASFDADPLITRPIASNILVELYDHAARIVVDARAITVPTQLLISGSDWVVRHGPQHEFFVNLASPAKERHVLPGFFHDTLGERDRAQALDLIRPFLERQFAAPEKPVDLTGADRAGYTRDEADRLASPLAPLSPKGLYWAMSRASIRMGAWLSPGMKTGIATGFDSGSTLDYVYENEARGMGPFGRMIDRTFLDAIGWRGIRQRKLHLEELIGSASATLKATGRPVHIVDIAAGHGRYVLDAVAKFAEPPASVRLQDYSDLNVGLGCKLIAERHLPTSISFHKADAFDAGMLADLAPAPDLAIVSGLYELFADNELIARSLGGLAKAMQPGSLLIYTNQPWHPQLEMIARSLTSHRGGQAWVMRRRTQGEMDQLVAAGGFEKLDQRIDQWGIFTVSVARRV